MNAAGWEPPSAGNLPVAGWYADPAGSELVRWWDGHSWTSQTRWPWRPPEPMPTRAALRLANWLASPALTALAAGTAAVTATGWLVGVYAAALAASGQPPTQVIALLRVGDAWVFPVLEVLAGLATLAARAARRTLAPSPARSMSHLEAEREARRVERRQARRLSAADGARPPRLPARATLRRALAGARPRRLRAFPTLPAPLGWA